VPPVTDATKSVPSADDATETHARALSLAVHVIPASVDVKICPPETAATRLVPSAEDATEAQLRLVSCAVQASPELVEV
jgi:hypothetical protein